MRGQGTPIRRHSRPKGRCEAVFWRSFAGGQAPRYMQAAERYERAGKAAGKRVGPLGPVGLEVLREMLRLVDYKTGRLEPSITYLMVRLKRSRDAVCRALANLRRHGFLDWLRRFEIAEAHGEKGPQIKQATNAYRLVLPPAALRLLGHLGRNAPAPEDHVHAVETRRASQAAMVAALPLNETPAALGGQGKLLGALEVLAVGVMRREKERESAKQTESHLKPFISLR